MRTVSFWNPIGVSLVLSVSLWDPHSASAAGGGADFELRASALGEQTARLTANANLGGLSLKAGGESAGSAQAPLRHAAIAGASISLDSWELGFEGKLAPPQAGAAGASCEATLRKEAEPIAATLTTSAHGSSWNAQQLQAFGVALEIEAPLPLSLRASVRAAAYRVELIGVSPNTSRSRPAQTEWRPGPWDRFGTSTLDWPERWETGVELSRTFGMLGAQINGGVGAPAADGALAARGGMKILLRLGPAVASIGAAAARLWPSGQVLAEVALSLGVRLGGVP